jgi:glycosyltransferase involved in cell wall biosynthesis
LSAVIITKNEEKNVAKCLKSLSGIADEIIVIDSFSTDNTQKICEGFGARFFQREWNGYSEAKNFGNKQAKNDWIISLDADEELSPELQNSILGLKKSGTKHLFYAFNRLTNYCGQWIRHGGWYPDTKVRLFDRKHAEWKGDFVHEKLVYADAIKPIKLSGDCHHYSFNSIAQHVAKENHYSTLAAEARLAKGKKYSLFKLLTSPGITFFRMYFLRLGFLDGAYGFIIAVISAHARFLRYAKMKTKVVSRKS